MESTTPTLKLSIRQGLLLFITLASLILAGVAGLGVWGTWRGQESLREVLTEEVYATQQLVEVYTQLTSIPARMYGVLNGDTSAVGARSHLVGARLDLALGWRRYRAALAEGADEEEKTLIAAIDPPLSALPALLDRIDHLLAVDDRPAIAALLSQEWWDIRLQVMAPLSRLIELEQSHVEVAYAVAQGVYRQTLIGLGLLLAAGMAIFFGFSRRIFDHVMTRLGVIEDALTRIAAGDLETRIGGSHSGEFGRIVGALDRTVSSLRADRQALEILQQGQASILESMAEGLYGTDAEGRITYANAAAEHLLGWSAGEMRGQFAHQMFHHTRADGTPYPVEDCPIHRACLTGQPCRSDDELFWRRDGSSFPVEMAGARIGTPERTVGSVVVFRDVTDQRSAKLALRANVERLTAINHRLEETQSQLLQSEKMASIGQLAAGVAHEINNPVAFVNANLSSLRCEVGDLLRVLDAYQAADPILAAHPAVMKTIAAARDAAELDYLRADIGALIDESLDGMQRVRKIVQDLKDFSRVGTAEWQFADLEDGLDSTLNIVWNEVKYKALVEKEYAGLPKVECIAAQIHQVFMNLLVNAAQAIESHGTITLRTGFAGAEVWVEVEDTGQGIPAHELSRIFDPFFTTKPVGKGTGLGLSLAYSIAQRHRGRIEVSSQVGVGSRFRLVLPAMRVQAEVSASGEATG